MLSFVSLLGLFVVIPFLSLCVCFLFLFCFLFFCLNVEMPSAGTAAALKSEILQKSKMSSRRSDNQRKREKDFDPEIPNKFSNRFLLLEMMVKTPFTSLLSMFWLKIVLDQSRRKEGARGVDFLRK